MSLENRIVEDLKTAMKARDKATLRTLRAMKAQILLLKTDGTGDEITEEKEIKLLQKMAKQRNDSLEIFKKQNRADLAVTEEEELAVITQYLPKQLDEADLKNIIQEIVTTTGASSMKDMGKVMGMASKQLAGKADGKTISNLVKQLLG